MERISRVEMAMGMARLLAKRSTCLRLQIGALLTLEGRPLSWGYNGAPSKVSHCDATNCTPEKPCTRTLHAESNAISWAARKGIATEGSVLYTTHSPCQPCAKLILNAGIISVIYDIPYRDSEGLALLQVGGVYFYEYEEALAYESKGGGRI